MLMITEKAKDVNGKPEFYCERIIHMFDIRKLAAITRGGVLNIASKARTELTVITNEKMGGIGLGENQSIK